MLCKVYNRPSFGNDGFLYQLYIIVSGIEWERGQFGFNTWDEPSWVSVFIKIVAAASIFFIIVASRNLSRDDRILTFTIGLTLAINLSGPLGWVHYYLPIIIFAPALPLLLGRRLGWAIVGAISLAFYKAN